MATLWLTALAAGVLLLLTVVVLRLLVPRLRGFPRVQRVAPRLFTAMLVYVAVFVGWTLYCSFNLPSASMSPTLVPGDVLLVNRFAYQGGGDPPRRGELVLFQRPDAQRQLFVKRVIAVPGDTISYQGKKLSVNGRLVTLGYQGQAMEAAFYGRPATLVQRWRESLEGRTYQVQVVPEAPALNVDMVADFPQRGNCRYDDNGLTCTVPAGQYFMMGDNRDDSFDSRYWGFVPSDLIMGRVTMVWWNMQQPARMGTRIE